MSEEQMPNNSIDGTKKLNKFFGKAPTKIMLTTTEKNNSFKAKIAEKSQKYKYNTIVPLDSLPQQSQIENDIKENKPSQQIVQFITNAPQKISSQNQSSFSDFTKALLLKSKTVDEQPASKRLSVLISKAPDTISKKNQSSFRSFKQNLLQKSKTVNENIETNKPSAIILKFLSKAPGNISKTNKTSFDNFKKALNQQTNQKLKISENKTKENIGLGFTWNQSNVNQFTSEGVQEDQVQKLVLNFFYQAPTKIKKENSNQFKKLSEKIVEKKELKKKSLVLHPKFEDAQQLPKNEEESSKFQDEIHDLNQEDMTQIIRQKTPYPDNSLSDAQIINMMQQDESQKQTKRQMQDQSDIQQKQDTKHQFQKNPNELNTPNDSNYDQYISYKEKLRDQLMNELNLISHEIQEIRQHKQMSDKQKEKKQFFAKNDIRSMINISENQVAFSKADDLIQRMNRQRREMRLRKEHGYKKIDQLLKRDMNALKEQQEKAIAYKNEYDRKYKIVKKSHEYQLQQQEFMKLQQANQEFVRALIQKGPQNGKLAEQFQEKAQNIKGEVHQRLIVQKIGVNNYLPSIKSIPGQKQLALKQFEEKKGLLENRQRLNFQKLFQQSMPKYSSKVKLPTISQQQIFSSQVLKKSRQSEVENEMIRKYKKSREQLLRGISQQNLSKNQGQYDNQFQQEQEYLEDMDEQQSYQYD